MGNCSYVLVRIPSKCTIQIENMYRLKYSVNFSITLISFVDSSPFLPYLYKILVLAKEFDRKFLWSLIENSDQPIGTLRISLSEEGDT